MREVDFHSHTLFSRCGLHSVIEMLTHAKRAGLTGLAITDHGPMLKGSTPSTFFDRLAQPLDGITMLKGMECNIKNDDGEIDFPLPYLRFADIVLLGLHPGNAPGLSRESYTSLMLRALDKNPFVDIVTHPEDPAFPLDLMQLADYASDHGIALEINNSKALYKRFHVKETIALIEACKKAGCRVAVDSDAHAFQEIGLDSSVLPLLERAKFPEGLIMNATAEGAFGFVEERRKIKKEFIKS
ncbi:MAG: PHP domain-containing protein [Chitinivibrionales bacterium]